MTATPIGGENFGVIKHVLKGRWFTIFAAIMMMSMAGSTFIFGAYSNVIKNSLDYDQSTLNLISAYKDAGSNIGIFAGLIAEVTPTWLVILIGAAMNFAGYGVVWLAVQGVINQPQVWLMCVSIFVGVNAQTFLSTGVLVTCVKNFPESRGLILGILKGYMAISGAVMAQFYLAIYGPDDGQRLIYLIAWLPSAVSLVFLFVFRPLKRDKHPNETRVFYHFLYASILLAMFLMFITIIQFRIQFSPVAYAGTATMICCLFFLSFIISVKEEKANWDYINKNKFAAAAAPPPNSIGESEAAAAVTATTSYRFTWKSVRDEEQKKGWSSCFGDVFDKPRRGEDYTILQALLSTDMMIITAASMFGFGSIFTAIDNMGQVGEALGYSQNTIATCIVLLNVWNFFGRVFAGFASESLLINYAVSRPALLSLFMLLSGLGHLLIAFPGPGSVYAASVILGITMGAMVPLICTIISEIFGLKYYFTLYNCGQFASPLGAYALNVLVTGRLYDIEAEKQAKKIRGTHDLARIVCRGVACFQTSFMVLTCTALCGAILSFVLAKRTDEFYRVDIVRIYKGEFYQKFDHADDLDHQAASDQLDAHQKGEPRAIRRLDIEDEEDENQSPKRHV